MKSLITTGLTIALIGLRACAIPAQANGAAHQTASKDEKRLLQGKFRLLTHVSELPAAVKKAFPDKAMQHEFIMADPGQEWQVTDVIIKPNLPVRRLIFAGLSDDCCVLYYERGGIAHSFQALIFRLSKNGAHFIGTNKNGKRYPDLPTLIKALQSEGMETETASRYF